jgi:copper chaperone CopZ
MKTSVIEVRDMLSVLSVLGVEKRIGEVPGVESVTVNYAAGSATVRYDETRLGIADIKAGVRQSEYESAAASAGDDHTSPGASPAVPAPAAPKSAPEAAASKTVTAAPKSLPAAASTSVVPKSTPDAAALASTAPAGDRQQDKAAPDKG